MPSAPRRAFVPLLLCSIATNGAAQRAAGVGDDAYVLPRGAVRAGLALDFAGWDERFAPSGRREAFASALSTDLTIERVAPGSDYATRLRQLTGTNGAGLTLGRIGVAASVRAFTLPLQAEAGVTRWMSVGVTIPFVRTRTAIVATADSAVLGANAGLNPAFVDAAALARNTTLVGQLEAAARRREESAGLPAGGCGTSANTACALVNEVRQAADDIATIYGTDDAPVGEGGSVAVSPVVPLAESEAQAAVTARIADLKSRLGTEGAAITIAAPAPAIVPIGTDALRLLMTDPRVGLAYDPFRLVERVHLGDVELTARVRLFDRIGALGEERAARGVALRSALTGVVRLPTGQGESDANLLDVGTGDGQLDLELRGALDVLVGSAVWVTGVARATRQFADDQFVRAPFAAGDPFVPSANRRRARRDLGDVLELEATPRWMPSEFLSVGASYQYRSKRADRYDAADTPGAGDVGLLGVNTASYAHAVGLGLTYSTLAAARRGARTLPMDITYEHRRIVRATGGFTPSAASDRLRLRIWTGLGGR